MDAPPKKSSATRVWLMKLLRFTGKCLWRAQFGKWWVAVVNAATLVCGWILVWIIFRHQDWTAQNQAVAGLLLVFLVPVTLGAIFGFLRLLISPFLVYQDLQIETGAQVVSAVTERDQARDELEDLKATRPDFVLAWERSTASTWVGWDPRRRTTIAMVWGRISFQNNGQGVAYNTHVNPYLIWLSNPSQVFQIRTPRRRSRTPQNQFIGYDLRASEPARQTGIDQTGQPILGFSPDGLIVLLEIESRANATDGQICLQTEWVYWNSTQPNSFYFPDADVVEIAQRNIDYFKQNQNPAQTRLQNLASSKHNVESCAPACDVGIRRTIR